MRTVNLKSIFFPVVASCLLVCCTNDDNAVVSRFTVQSTVEGDTQYYSGLTLQMGEAGSTDVLATAVVDAQGKAVFQTDISLLAGKNVWFCVPRMVKFFHTLTAEEVAANSLTLPDKDKGSTVNGYVNDWIVALYMGVNKGGEADTAPLYWATGNLIAVKTNGAGEPSEVAYHIATAAETEEEGCPGNSLVGLDERLIANVPDGYVNMPAGSKWDMYAFGDRTGLMLYDQEKLPQFGVQSGQMDKTGGNVCYDISGDPRFDATRAHLGGLWRLPTCGKTGLNEFAAFEDDCEEYADLLPDGQTYGTVAVNFGVKYDYTVNIDGKDITVNTLILPAAGYRHAISSYANVGKSSLYWSGTADPTGTPPYTPNGIMDGMTMPDFYTAFNYGYLDKKKTWFPHPRTSSQALRPVTE